MDVYDGAILTSVLGLLMGFVLGLALPFGAVLKVIALIGIALIFTYPQVVRIESRYVGSSTVLPPTMEGLRKVNQQESIAFMLFAIIGSIIGIAL